MKSTNKDFEIFKKECEKWLEFFGIKEWRCEYKFEDLDNDRARVEFYNSGRVATFFLTTKIKLSEYQIRESAFHEVCELMLADCYHHMRIHNVDEERITEMQHTIIRRLENCVFKELAKKKKKR